MRLVIQIALRLSTVIGVLAPLALAHAQDVTGDRARAALERTDERIRLAQSLVAGADNAQAELELNAAIGIQAQARSVFDQGMAASGDTRLRLLQQSVDLTLRARARADRAISLIQGLPDPDRVLSQVERTREMLDRARNRIEGCDSDRAQALLRASLDMQTRAEAAARESRYLAALQLTLSARERGLRALRLCNMEENLQEAADRALHRTDQVISRARELVARADHERAKDVLTRAERVQGQAYEQVRGGHFEAALRVTQSARTLAYRAVRLAGGIH
ncbi:MAG TPA: hypothetical protein VFQ05_01225 [Candidatus Eisenbacteria bacterium]|nr:hypothetical protein [Candidatus Eisenbacteria bacterium]